MMTMASAHLAVGGTATIVMSDGSYRRRDGRRFFEYSGKCPISPKELGVLASGEVQHLGRCPTTRGAKCAGDDSRRRSRIGTSGQMSFNHTV
jgi:hypothetical protein